MTRTRFVVTICYCHCGGKVSLFLQCGKEFAHALERFEVFQTPLGCPVFLRIFEVYFVYETMRD
jgi:hypothetical protein